MNEPIPTYAQVEPETWLLRDALLAVAEAALGLPVSFGEADAVLEQLVAREDAAAAAGWAAYDVGDEAAEAAALAEAARWRAAREAIEWLPRVEAPVRYDHGRDGSRLNLDHRCAVVANCLGRAAEAGLDPWPYAARRASTRRAWLDELAAADAAGFSGRWNHLVTTDPLP